MSHERIDLRLATGRLQSGHSWELAVTVHVRAGELTADAPVLVCLPGGRYNRRYFDLQEPGYSEAEYHAGQGVIVIAIDHVRVGESDMPDLQEASLPATAEANHAVLQVALQRLREGTLRPGLQPITPSAVVGEGQSMGGHIALLMQARHRSFDGLAMLGSSVSCTRLPARDRSEDICLLGKNDPAEGMAKFAAFDWRYAFHWEDVPEHYAATEAPGAAGTPYWRSDTSPNASGGLIPGHFAADAAQVTVPVLLAMGERDVTQDPLRELAAFMSTPDLAYFIVPRMAHMHNFASTRHRLWSRLGVFVRQVAELRRNP
ncbi:alpha/beta hydrolase [Novosphingobium sp. M1R2S20]|uniref:Alpha/beta hydrolase n=1 Tax=Novosphingobium rhizovicinum TaxID=3228928 RepID=A0ABV3RG64_9SPHN